jgi:acetyl esterase/lipase
VAGDSAGGGLALAVLLAARDAGDPSADGGITISAWTDMAITGASVKAFEKTDPVMGGRVAPEAALAYVGAADPRDPLASPLYGEYKGMPPLLMQVGAIEVLLDDTRRIVDKARSAGVDVTSEEWPDMVHCWHLYAAILPEGRQAIDSIGEWVRARVPQTV